MMMIRMANAASIINEIDANTAITIVHELFADKDLQ